MSEESRKVKVIRVPDPLPGYETAYVDGHGGFIFHDGEGYFDPPIAQLLVDNGVAAYAAEQRTISIPSGIAFAESLPGVTK